MVTYGDWRQDPDYTSNDSAVAGSTPSAFSAVVFDGYGIHTANQEDVRTSPEPYYPVNANDMAVLLAQARSGAGTDQILTLGGVHVGFGYMPDPHPTLVTRQTVSVARPAFTIRPRPGGHWYNPPNYGYGDPNAIGIEYEGQPYNPDEPFASGPAVAVGLTIRDTTALEAPDFDTTNPDGEIFGTYDTQLRVDYGGVFDLGTSLPSDLVPLPAGGTRPRQATLGMALDLTALRDHGWAANVWTDTATLVMPAVTSGGVGSVEYGWSIERLHIAWTVRPPVYRYVYGSTPYRRTYPRDDGLAGGAGRNYPAPRSAQGSNRIVGGYL